MTFVVEDGVKIRDIGSDTKDSLIGAYRVNSYSLENNVLFNSRNYTIERLLSTELYFFAHWT